MSAGDLPIGGLRSATTATTATTPGQRGCGTATTTATTRQPPGNHHGNHPRRTATRGPRGSPRLQGFLECRPRGPGAERPSAPAGRGGPRLRRLRPAGGRGGRPGLGEGVLGSVGPSGRCPALQGPRGASRGTRWSSGAGRLRGGRGGPPGRSGGRSSAPARTRWPSASRRPVGRGGRRPGGGVIPGLLSRGPGRVWGPGPARWTRWPSASRTRWAREGVWGRERYAGGSPGSPQVITCVYRRSGRIPPGYRVVTWGESGPGCSVGVSVRGGSA